MKPPEAQPDVTPATELPVLHPSHHVAIQLVDGLFVQKDNIRAPKALPKSQQITSSGFPWPSRWAILSQKEIKFDRQDFPLMKLC